MDKKQVVARLEKLGFVQPHSNVECELYVNEKAIPVVVVTVCDDPEPDKVYLFSPSMLADDEQTADPVTSDADIRVAISIASGPFTGWADSILEPSHPDF